jgi:hypothetical protein
VRVSALPLLFTNYFCVFKGTKCFHNGEHDSLVVRRSAMVLLATVVRCTFRALQNIFVFCFNNVSSRNLKITVECHSVFST